MPAGEGFAFGSIAAKVHRTPPAFAGPGFMDE